MSLAVPYILDAAAQTNPHAVLTLGGVKITAHELSRRTQARADRYLDDGFQPGNPITFPPAHDLDGLIDALSAVRVGLVLSDNAASPDTGADRPLSADRHVCESRLWSQSPLARTAGVTITHGDTINAAAAHPERLPVQLQPILRALRVVGRAMADADASGPGAPGHA